MLYTAQMRIQKYMSEQGIASRREAERLIKEGLVMLNGRVIREMGVQIDPAKDQVKILASAKAKLPQKTSVVFYKPRGIASSRLRNEGKTVYDLLPQFIKLNIIGRLDRASEGLLLLSDDGVIAKAVTGEQHLMEKEYLVKVREETNAGRLKKLEPGIVLDDPSISSGQARPTLPCKTKFLDQHTFLITLREGRKHQIRRMCAFLNLTITNLKRLRIGPLKLSNLQPGKFRLLTPQEVSALKK